MHPLFGFLEGALSPTHILIVLVVGLLVFGKRLPEIGRSLGKGIVEFKKGMKGLEEEIEARADPRQEPAAGQVRPPQCVVTRAHRVEDNSEAISPSPRV